MFRSTHKSALSSVIFSTSSARRFPRCSKAGPLTISPLTSCCDNTISLLVLASFCLVLSHGSPSGVGPDWPRARTLRGSSRGPGPVRPSVFSASDGSAPWRISTSRRLSESAASHLRARNRVGWNQLAGDGSTRRTDGATQRSAGRTPPLCVWAPSCSAGRSERTAGSRCGRASHALRHVSSTQSSAPAASAVCGTPDLAARWGSRGRAAAQASGSGVDRPRSSFQSWRAVRPGKNVDPARRQG
jgi:hypothetical protein